MIRGALISALSDRAAGGKVIVVRDWPWTAPSTKEAVKALRALETDGRVVIVVAPDDEITFKSFRNLPEVHLLPTNELNAYDVLCSDWLIFTEMTLPGPHVDTAPVRVDRAPRSAAATTSEPAVEDAVTDTPVDDDVVVEQAPSAAGGEAETDFDPFAEDDAQDTESEDPA
jgi:large subunit ribosomal protein L4